MWTGHGTRVLRSLYERHRARSGSVWLTGLAMVVSFDPLASITSVMTVMHEPEGMASAFVPQNVHFVKFVLDPHLQYNSSCVKEVLQRLASVQNGVKLALHHS